MDSLKHINIMYFKIQIIGVFEQKRSLGNAQQLAQSEIIATSIVTPHMLLTQKK